MKLDDIRKRLVAGQGVGHPPAHGWCACGKLAIARFDIPRMVAQASTVVNGHRYTNNMKDVPLCHSCCSDLELAGMAPNPF